MEEGALFQMQPCILCKGETTREYVELIYTYPRFTIVVKGVPAAVCACCGEQFVPGDVGVWLGDEVATLAAQLQATVAGEDALRDVVLNVSIDEEQLVASGRVRKLAFA